MSSNKIKEIVGKGIVVRGNDIDTDRIIPARFLKEITFENMEKYLFYDERFDEKGNKKNHPFNEEKYKGASILAVNKNFGCGSSREHAPQSLMRWGIKAVIGESFGDIFSGNCSMIGLPAVIVSKNDIEKIMEFIESNPNKEINIDIESKEIIFDSSRINLEINDSMRKSFIDGTWDTISLMLNAKKEIKKTIERLPYMNDFKTQ